MTSKVLTTQDSEAQSLLCSVEGTLLNTGPATHTLPGNCSLVLWPAGLLSYVCLVACPIFPDQFARIQLLSLALLLRIIISGQSDFQSGWNSLSKLGEINSRWKPKWWVGTVNQTWQLVTMWSCGWREDYACKSTKVTMVESTGLEIRSPAFS